MKYSGLLVAVQCSNCQCLWDVSHTPDSKDAVLLGRARQQCLRLSAVTCVSLFLSHQLILIPLLWVCDVKTYAVH